MSTRLTPGPARLLILGLALPLAATAASLPANDLSTPANTTLHGGGDGITIKEREHKAHGIANHLLARGQALYRDLLTARQAAQDHNALDTRMALDAAERMLDTLYAPSDLDALMRASRVIRHDLGQPGHRPDPKLWLPLRAELTRVQDEVPAARLSRAKHALEVGAGASARGDRAAAGRALDDLENAVGYRFALLPAHRLREDLHAAEAAMVTDPPRWQGVTVALDSAVGSVHWANDVHASGWLSAYQYLADAYGELGPHPTRARRDLSQAADALSGWPAGSGIAAAARRLAHAGRLDESQVVSLMDRVQAVIPGA